MSEGRVQDDPVLVVGILSSYAMLGLVMIKFLLPANHWFNVTRFDVLDSVQGQPIAFDYDRDINREFDGVGRVKVWRIESEDLIVVCPGDDQTQTYRPGTRLPENLTLEWLSYGECKDLPPGEYQVEAKWTINPDSFLRRTVVREDEFHVLGS